MGNLYSPFAYKETEIFGKTTPPEDVTGFQMVAQGSKANFTWTPVADLDVIHGGNYWLRYTSDVSASWSASSTIDDKIPGNASSYLGPLLSGRYLLKAVDSSGNESVNSVIIVSNVADILNLNVIDTLTEDPNFGDDTSDEGINDTNTSNIYYDSTNNAITLGTASLATGTHDEYYATGTNTDVIDTYDSTQNSILDDNSGSNYTAFISENWIDSASGNVDDRSGNIDTLAHTTNKLEDDNASFTSSWLNQVVRNITDDTTANVTAVDDANTLTLDADIFDGGSEDYRLEVQENILRDLTVDFTTASVSLVGRTVRLDDGTTATVSSVNSATQITLSSDLMEDNHGADYHIEWGPYQVFDSSANFGTEVVGKTIRNTTEGTSATVSARVSQYELTLDDTIFDHQDGDSYTIEVDTKVLRDTGASFDSTHANRIIRNVDTDAVTSVVSVDSGTELTINSDIFPTDGANYKIEGDVESEGYYYFTNMPFDLGATYQSRVSATFDSDSYDVLELFDATSGNFDSRSGLFDGTDISSTNAVLQVRTTTDDPNSSPTWTSWNNFYIGDYLARGFQFRMKLTSTNTTQNIQVTSLSVVVDMPDVIKRDYNVTSDSGTNNGTKVITYANPFKTTPTVGITTTASNDKISWTISSSTNTGFTVTFYDNNANQASQETFNWISSGY